ncbi:acyltransferase [Natronosporangium hydrolyticum]|uniref:Acyltransferase n=1 Tax=Natronosporangium hydrolyticum TaxID=2811111 RepID=A0A895YI98_9ACTN|nr:acyltransferase [Natronosporangium hydrolyticum]QSB13478.1 acyltransferase [Natronosporangium hydrolyticum]
MNPADALRAANRTLDELVTNTPARRERYVDFLRVFAIGVVVLWHWALSIHYWSEAQHRWVMPNPIHEVPGGWAATWLLQIVTVFFVVGGYANGAAWWAAQQGGAGVASFYRARFQRLLVPVAVFLAVWAVFDLALLLLVPGYTGVLNYGQILFTPLWFIGAYLWVVLLVPVTATLHERHKWLTLFGLAAVIAAADLGRFAAGWSELGWVNSALVWVFAHQLGYFFRDGTLDRLGRLGAAGLVVAAVAALVGLTELAGYPRSMVATVGQEYSNILPTTLPIAVVAVLQVGVMLLIRAPVSRWLRRPRVWKVVVAANAVILTVFLWHMTALLAGLATLRGLGVPLRTEPTLQWWLERPLWVLAPAIVLVILVAVFGSFEWASGRWLRRVGRMTRRG